MTITHRGTATLLAASLAGSLLGGQSAAVPTTAAAVVRAAPEAGFDWPLHGTPAVLVPFEPPVTRFGPGHRGVDLAASPGAVVLSPARGVVSFTGRVAGRGVVTVQHDGGLRTSLEPVSSVLAVGQRVSTGDVVATLDAGGHCPESCLHWGVRRGIDYLDPLTLVRGAGPPVLLPVTR